MKPRVTQKMGVAVAAMLAAAVHAPSVLAQAPNAGQVLESAPAPARPPSTLPPVAAPDRPNPPAAANGPRLAVKGFALEGNTVFSTAELQVLLQPYVNRDLSMDELTEATDLVKDKYRNAGYFLAQALLPSQQVADGIVQIRVVEGSIGVARATLGENTRVSQGLVDGYMGLLPSGALVTEQSVERPLLLLNDLPGLRVRSVLKPGQAFGQADLDVEVQADGPSFGGSIYADTYGNRNTGSARLGVDLEGRGLLGLGDLISVSGLVAEHGDTLLGRAGITLPVGSYGTKVSLSYTDLSYEVGGVFSPLNADGYGKVLSLLVQHPFIRSRNANVFFQAGLDGKSIDDKQQNGSLNNKRRLTSARFGVNGDFRDDYLGGALNSYTMTLFLGDNDIRTPSALLSDQSFAGYNTQGSFAKVQFEYLRLQGIPETAGSVLLALRGQIASKNLDSSEKSSLGGPRGVRSYPVGAGSGDDLLMGTVEYRYRVPEFTLVGAPLVLSTFLDYGVVRGFHSPRPNDRNNTIRLGAVGIGLNLTKRDDFQVRVDLATRVGKDEYQGDDNKRTRLWALLQKWF